MKYKAVAAFLKGRAGNIWPAIIAALLLANLLVSTVSLVQADSDDGGASPGNKNYHACVEWNTGAIRILWNNDDRPVVNTTAPTHYGCGKKEHNITLPQTAFILEN